MLTRRNLREYAEQRFAREGVEARPNSKITAVGPDWIELDGKTKGWSRPGRPGRVTDAQSLMDF
jgi:NADH dehydrogenase FAD-containing subunit